MKMTKTLVAILLAGFVLQQLAPCQTNVTDASPTAATGAATNAAPGSDASGATASNAVAPAAAVAVPPAAPQGEPPAGATASNVTASVTPDASASNAPAAPAMSNEVASGVSATNAAPVLSGTNATAQAGATNSPAAGGTNVAAQVPIQFQDVPITTAIESLARLANINYLLDPKIGFGQPGPNGQPNPEPVLSVRWEHVTAKQALLALLDNYGLQLVEEPKTGISKITIKPPNQLPPLLTRVVQLQYASTSNLESSVQGLLTSEDNRSRVVADARTSQLVVVTTEAGQAKVDILVSNLDKPTRQVLIETKLVELSSNPSTKKGIDWTGTLQAQNVAFGNGTLAASTETVPGTTTPGSTSPSGATISPAGTSGSSLATTVQSLFTPLTPGFSASTSGGLTPNTGFLTADGVKAVLSFLNQSTEAQVVSTPRVVTLDNETATISVIRQVPIINVTAGTANTTGGSTISYSNVGTILRVTPRITANDYIWLKVVPEVSSAEPTQRRTVNGQPFDVQPFDLRHVETQVFIPNAHTLVMGGLVQDNPAASYTKVPLLGDIPVLGLAFRSENKSMQKQNLLIFITPTIVQQTDFKLAETDFLNSQPVTMKDPMNPHTKWDGARPNGDWSNPIPGQDAMAASQNTAAASQNTVAAPQDSAGAAQDSGGSGAAFVK